VVAGEHGRWILKQYREQTQPYEIAYIHSILLHLERQRFPATRLVPTLSGQDHAVIDGHHYALFRYEPGYRGDSFMMMKQLRHRHIRQAATTLARFHRLTAGLAPSGRRDRGYKAATHKERWDPYDAYPSAWFQVANVLARQQSKGSPISLARVDAIAARMAWLAKAEQQRDLLPLVITHGDYGPWNLLFQPIGFVKCVIDFDDVSLEERVEEVAASLLAFTVTRRARTASLEDAQVFMRAYHEENPLTTTELECMPEALNRRFLKHILIMAGTCAESQREADSAKLSNLLRWLNWMDSPAALLVREACSPIQGEPAFAQLGGCSAGEFRDARGQ
jgi:Ser/Thr protein kinase RdoA (MazF antagonist)